jgi:hypothetical protein
MNFKENLQHLLITQSQLLKNSTFGKKILFWQEGVDEPSILELTELAKETGYSIDSLININIANGVSPQHVSGENIRVLATTVSESNEENIEIVPIKAKAGYACGYGDPDYLKVLPAFQLPFLSRDKKYRSFEIEGDSMPPLAEGDFVTGEFIRNWNYIKNGYPYIIVTKNEGIVFKIVINQIIEHNCLKLYSTNVIYKPYELPLSEVIEVWKFVNYISNEAPALTIDSVNQPLIKVI